MLGNGNGNGNGNGMIPKAEVAQPGEKNKEDSEGW
jgi:hypothetical protein